MTITITIILLVVAAIMAAAGLFFLFSPAPQTDEPVKGPVDVVKIRSAVSATEPLPDEEQHVEVVPVNDSERQLELSDNHPGDIIVDRTIQESGTSAQDIPFPDQEPPEEEGTPQPGRQSDEVGESSHEETEGFPETVPERPLELFEGETY